MKPCPYVEYKHLRFILIQFLFAFAAIESCRHSSSHLSIIFLFSFFFTSKQDGFRVKIAFASSRFENPPLKISHFSTVFNSKHKICCLNVSWMTKQLFNIIIQIFIRLTRSTEKDFSLETVPSDKKSNSRTCAEGCQMPFKLHDPARGSLETALRRQRT